MPAIAKNIGSFIQVKHLIDIAGLAEYIWRRMNYYGISEHYKPTPRMDKWLSEQGLISVKDPWVKIHYLVTPDNFNEPPYADPLFG